jgi:hypothetical protein
VRGAGDPPDRRRRARSLAPPRPWRRRRRRHCSPQRSAARSRSPGERLSPPPVAAVVNQEPAAALLPRPRTTGSWARRRGAEEPAGASSPRGAPAGTTLSPATAPPCVRHCRALPPFLPRLKLQVWNNNALKLNGVT